LCSHMSWLLGKSGFENFLTKIYNGEFISQELLESLSWYSSHGVSEIFGLHLNLTWEFFFYNLQFNHFKCNYVTHLFFSYKYNFWKCWYQKQIFKFASCKKLQDYYLESTQDHWSLQKIFHYLIKTSFITCLIGMILRLKKSLLRIV